jgi:hypothetical protein
MSGFFVSKLKLTQDQSAGHPQGSPAQQRIRVGVASGEEGGGKGGAGRHQHQQQ